MSLHNLLLICLSFYDTRSEVLTASLNKLQINKTRVGGVTASHPAIIHRSLRRVFRLNAQVALGVDFLPSRRSVLSRQGLGNWCCAYRRENVGRAYRYY